MRALLAAVVLVAVVLVGSTEPALATPEVPDPAVPTPTHSVDPTAPSNPTTGANGDSVYASLTDVIRAQSAIPGGNLATTSVAPSLVRYLRAEVCGLLSGGAGYAWPCSDGRVVDHSDVCGDAPLLLPLWRSERPSAGAPWSDYVLVADLTCVGGPVPSAEQVLSEFRRLPIAASVVRVQPDRGWVLVNKETIAYTDPAPQTLGATVLGVPVTFQVTAASFTWDFGETVFTTTSPGHPYPHQDVSYPFTHPGTGRVVLTTTWSATYTVGDDPTVRPVPGTATTVSTSAPFEVREVSAHLTRGTCEQYPHDPGC